MHLLIVLIAIVHFVSSQKYVQKSGEQEQCHHFDWNTSRENDLITDLPGMPDDAPPNLVQYSGYLQALGTRRLHYW